MTESYWYTSQRDVSRNIILTRTVSVCHFAVGTDDMYALAGTYHVTGHVGMSPQTTVLIISGNFDKFTQFNLIECRSNLVILVPFWAIMNSYIMQR